MKHFIAVFYIRGQAKTRDQEIQLQSLRASSGQGRGFSRQELDTDRDTDRQKPGLENRLSPAHGVTIPVSQASLSVHINFSTPLYIGVGRGLAEAGKEACLKMSH